MCYYGKQRIRDHVLERLQSECDIVIRYYRSTVIPDDNKSKVFYRIVKNIPHVKELRD